MPDDQIPDRDKRSLAELLLSIADDKLILGHRNADWTGLAPILEEDIAYSSLAQDEIAHASAFYDLAARLTGTTADRLAYGRAAAEYRCAELVEFSDEFDWALALARSFYCDHFDRVRLGRLVRSKYRTLAELASRLAAEEQIHVDHVDSWIHRLGCGGPEACERMQKALDSVGTQAHSLFETNDSIRECERLGYYPGDEHSMYDSWLEGLRTVAQKAGLAINVAVPDPSRHGGRRGHHSAGFAALIDELTEVYRIEPEAAW
jgi:ring-1,2-phenylacetyl-CoA epoxidase subunit PaaC